MTLYLLCSIALKLTCVAYHVAEPDNPHLFCNLRGWSQQLLHLQMRSLQSCCSDLIAVMKADDSWCLLQGRRTETFIVSQHAVEAAQVPGLVSLCRP